MINQWISVMWTWAQWGLRDVIINVGLVMGPGEKVWAPKGKAEGMHSTQAACLMRAAGQVKGMLQGSDRFSQVQPAVKVKEAGGIPGGGCDPNPNSQRQRSPYHVGSWMGPVRRRQRVRPSFQLQLTSESPGQVINRVLQAPVWVRRSTHTFSQPLGYPGTIVQRTTPKDGESRPYPFRCW